jgi:hypothetical protein
MKTFKLFLLLFLLFSSRLFAQDVDDYLDFFSNLIGKWESTYEVNDGIINKEQWEIKWILNKHFVEIYEKGEPDKYPGQIYEEKYLFSLDENDKLIGWIFGDSREYLFSKFKGELVENLLKFKGKGKNFSYSTTLELKDGKLIRTGEGEHKGKKFQKVVAVYKRIK